MEQLQSLGMTFRKAEYIKDFCRKVLSGEFDLKAEAFQLPENEEILTCLALGYPAEGAGPLANHNSRKPIEETVTYL